VGCAIVLRDFRRTATDNDALPAFVKDVGYTRLEGHAVACLVEADADVAGVEGRRVPHEPPRDSAGLVVKGGEEVPGEGGVVLDVLVGGSIPAVPLNVAAKRSGPRDLDRSPDRHGPGLEQVMEIDSLFGWLALGFP
jgi:hypothetical protein